MLSYCLKWGEKKTESINPKFLKTNNSKTMILSKAVVKNKNLLKSKKQEEYFVIQYNLSMEY